MIEYLKRHFSKERLTSVSSATFLVLASVFDFPWWTLWIFAVPTWVGLISVATLFASMVIMYKFRVITLIRLYVEVGLRSFGDRHNRRTILGQVLDNVPPIVTFCAWFSLSWPITAISVFLAWSGTRYLYYYAETVVSRLGYETSIKIAEH